jgi:hypothetical protein
MRIIKLTHLIITFLFAASISYAQVFIDADGVTDPYSQFHSKGWYEEETTLHPGFKHITQTWDNSLRKFVFNFIIHKDIDGDSGERVDRQRLEIKTYGSSPDYMKGFYGETMVNRWKFRLDTGFQPTSSFCHIHQLKASDATIDNSNPLITITPRKSSPNKLQLIYISSIKQGSTTTTLMEVPLTNFEGTWVEAYEKVKFHETGTYELTIKRVSDDSVLFSYSNSNINLWRDTTHASGTFIRPKYGIYRSLGTNLSQLPNLRDETVLYDDIHLYKGSAPSLPVTPVLLTASAASGKKINLSWSASGFTNGQFRIERSSSSTNWSYYATSKTSTYSDTGLTALTKYYYRVRAENALGNSDYSNTANATTTNIQANTTLSLNYELQNYPNPFNPSTQINYSIPKPSQVKLVIYDMIGREIETIVDEYQNAGVYHYTWKAAGINGQQLASGTYLLRLSAGDYSQTLKLLLIK